MLCPSRPTKRRPQNRGSPQCQFSRAVSGVHDFLAQCRLLPAEAGCRIVAKVAKTATFASGRGLGVPRARALRRPR